MLVIASNCLSGKELGKYAEGRSGYILFHDDENTDTLSRRLKSSGFEYIDLRDLIVSSRSALREAVIEFSGALNSNPSHPNWWAIRLSRRVAMYDFSNALAKLFILRMIINTGSWDTVIVYDNSVFPWNYLRDGKHQGETRVRTKFSLTTDWKARLKTILPVRTLLWFLRKIEIKTKLGWSPVKIKKTRHAPLVSMLTLIHKNSFTKKESFRDVYLGDLAKHFQEKGYSIFVLGQLHDKPSSDFLATINSQKSDSYVLLEHLWSFKDLVIVFKKALKDFFVRSHKWPFSHFAGFDVREFLDANLKLDLQGEYADSMLYYIAMKIFLEQTAPETLIYPYENKCIERMILKAISDVSPKTKTVGYQHAVLTPKHIHMFLAKGESQNLPLPDKIITNGPHTARMLNKLGNYPEGRITAGTALRQTSTVPDNFIKDQPPKRIKNVLLTLAEGSEEYNKAFAFLKDIQKNNETDGINFRIRLHPGIPYDPFKNETLIKGIKCKKDTVSSLLESVYWADVVMYASTSVAAQAMTMGIPVIWMDLLDFWGTDPITANNTLRWKLHSPGDWSKIISNIVLLPESDFGQRMKHSNKFVSECFCQDPVDITKWLGT